MLGFKTAVKQLAAETATNVLRARAEAREKRWARRTWPDRFRPGDLVQRRKRGIDRHTIHAVVTHVDKPCWNQRIYLSFDETTPTRSGWDVLAEQYDPVTCSSRVGCRCYMCAGWAKLSPWQRWKQRHVPVPCYYNRRRPDKLGGVCCTFAPTVKPTTTPQKEPRCDSIL